MDLMFTGAVNIGNIFDIKLNVYTYNTPLKRWSIKSARCLWHEGQTLIMTQAVPVIVQW